jgi:PAS domain S-box-containing protein
MKKLKSEREKIKETTKKTTARVIKEIAKAEGMLAAIGDGIAVVDRTLKVLYENQVHKDMMGDHVGEYCYKAYAKKEGICGGCPVTLTFKDGKVHAVQRELHTDTETRYVEITASPLKDSTGEIIAGIEVVRDITERKQADQKLREREERYRLLFNNVSDAIFVHEVMPDASASGRFIEVNDRACLYLGYSREELLQMSVHQIDAQETLANVPTILRKLFKEGHATWEGIHVSKDGRKIPVEISNQLFELHGKPMILSAVRDITERKRSEEALKLEAQLLDAATDSIFLLDFEGNLIYVNEAAYKSRGYTKDELMAMNLKDFHVPEYSKLIELRMQELMGKGEATFESAHFRKDGSILPIEVHARIIQVGAKKLVLSVTRDITDRKRAEETLQESEERFKDLFENANDLIQIVDAEGKYLYVNRKWCEKLGLTENEAVQLHFTDIVRKDQIPHCMENFRRIAKGETIEHMETIYVSKDGRELYLEGNMSPSFKDGKFISCRGIFRDITERKKAEEALRASEAELHDNYFSQSAINLILSESLKNIPLEEFLQKALNMILSIPWMAFESIGSISLVEDDADVLVMKAQSNLPEPLKKLCVRVPFGKCLCGKAAQTQKIEFADHIDVCHEIRYEGMYPHGHYSVPILFSGKTLGVLNIYLIDGHIRDKKEEEFLLTIADTLAGIIVRRQAEDEKEKLHAQLLQAQKMEAVGQLAGGIAHDFNNILTAMIGYGHLLKMKLKEEDPLRSYADHILSLSDKAANLTQSLLAFSRKQIINPRPVDINEIIRRIDHLLSRIIGEDIQLLTMLSENDLIVMADPGQIEQVLMNLATNARDAMPKGGLLTIMTETVDIDHVFIREHDFGKEEPYALISLTDTGAGIDRETREKIFEPFFTTKEVGKGTGLGLSMVYGIIKQHNGYINVYSEPGRGTTFRIYLPVIAAEAEKIKPEVIPPVITVTETLLLAEDETGVREFTKNLLKEYGYKVITAVDGQDAINEFKAYKNRIHLVLLDVIMPNKNGKEVYDEIKQIKPDIKVLFMSGYPADIIQKHGIIEKGLAYIEKPASPTKLLRKIREVLDK